MSPVSPSTPSSTTSTLKRTKVGLDLAAIDMAMSSKEIRKVLDLLTHAHSKTAPNAWAFQAQLTSNVVLKTTAFLNIDYPRCEENSRFAVAAAMIRACRGNGPPSDWSSIAPRMSETSHEQRRRFVASCKSALVESQLVPASYLHDGSVLRPNFLWETISASDINYLDQIIQACVDFLIAIRDDMLRATDTPKEVPDLEPWKKFIRLRLKDPLQFMRFSTHGEDHLDRLAFKLDAPISSLHPKYHAFVTGFIRKTFHIASKSVACQAHPLAGTSDARASGIWT